MSDQNSRPVFSTQSGKLCPNCRKPIDQCICKKKKTATPKKDGIVRIQRETKGRKGKIVTLITGVPLHPEGLEKLAKELKQKCGAGGTVKNGVIEIQGDHRDTLLEELSKKGYTVKKAGG